MAAIDYNELPLEKLEQIAKDVSKAIASYHDRKRKEAMERMNAVAKELGFTSASAVLDQAVLRKETTKQKEAREIVPVFRNPNNHAQVCGLRGRKPAWFNELKEQGYTEEQLMIANQ